MFLSELSIWNFRKYGIEGDSFESSKPGVKIPFETGLNILIGENDSGKTTIIDAIRYTLGTQSGDWIRITEDDFHSIGETRAEEFKVECVFRGFSDMEAGQFLEWMGTETVGSITRYVLTVRLSARIKGDRVASDLRAGPDLIGIPIDGDARALLRLTYLKPLRDADAELIPSRRSRFAQILKSHSLFQQKQGEEHELETIFSKANQEVDQYFSEGQPDSGASALMTRLRTFLEAFFPQSEKTEASVSISGGDLFDILQKLSLSLGPNPSGLGSANLLFIAAEMLLLQSDEHSGLKLALVEELEAHLHPQAQLRLIRYLEGKASSGQYILTTHSTTTGSSVPLKCLILCKGDKVFPMGPDHTKLSAKNYGFLYRFLDTTKANLFFARSVLLVEGDAENLMIPAIAKVLGRSLHRYGVSIVNVGSTAFAHFVRIFHRKDATQMGVKVALVTDMDVKPLEWIIPSGTARSSEEIEVKKVARRISLTALGNTEVKIFLSPNWTFEYEIGLSELRMEFYQAILWAEKVENSSTGEPQPDKLNEVIEKVKTDFERWDTDWATDPRKTEKIAFEVYNQTLLRKEISKSIVAQEFASLVESGDGERWRTRLKSSPSLEYLVNAIYHVTEPCESDHAP